MLPRTSTPAIREKTSRRHTIATARELFLQFVEDGTLCCDRGKRYGWKQHAPDLSGAPARQTGIEPVTHSLEGCCSIRLSYWRVFGVRGFEPPTAWSQTRCATGLRHTPRFQLSRTGARRACQYYFHHRAMSAYAAMLIKLMTNRVMRLCNPIALRVKRYA